MCREGGLEVWTHGRINTKLGFVVERPLKMAVRLDREVLKKKGGGVVTMEKSSMRWSERTTTQMGTETETGSPSLVK